MNLDEAKLNSRRETPTEGSRWTPAMARVLAFLCTAALIGCSRSEPVAFREAPSNASAEANPDGTQGTARLASRMFAHAMYGSQMRDAVLANDFATRKVAAKRLASLPDRTDLPAGMREHLRAMTHAAERVVEAPDVREAARSVASLAQTCGDCHSQFGGPKLSSLERPAESASLKQQMTSHQWAIARMWDGLVVPSDLAWREGASELVAARLNPALATPGRTPVPEIAALAESVRGIAQRSETAERNVRSGLFGNLLDACVQCHGWLMGEPATPVMQ